jgi:hypothetical protein
VEVRAHHFLSGSGEAMITPLAGFRLYLRQTTSLNESRPQKKCPASGMDAERADTVSAASFALKRF